MSEEPHTSLVPVSEALDRLRRGLQPVSKERVALAHAVGRVLAQEVVSETDLPPIANSAMDGYAVRAQDVQRASQTSPIVLDVIGDVAASVDPAQRLERGQAVRIMTGAPLPPGGDAVVPVEHTSTPQALAGVPLPDRIEVLKPVASGEYMRPAGQDVSRGEQVLKRGRRLRPADVGMLAALGVARPLVYQIPRVAILSTGDELLEVDQPLAPGQIRDANGYALTAAVRLAGAEPLRLGIVPDRLDAVVDQLELALEDGADLILSSAGVSMGAHDYVRLALEEHGELDFWRVDIRPGKPFAYGRFKQIPFLGLPGNPVSALVTFDVFARTAIAQIAGAAEERAWVVAATLEHDLESDGRESYLRASVRHDGRSYRARLTGSQDSGVLSSMVAANALLIVPSGTRRIKAGSQVVIWPLSSSGRPVVRYTDGSS